MRSVPGARIHHASEKLWSTSLDVLAIDCWQRVVTARRKVAAELICASDASDERSRCFHPIHSQLLKLAQFCLCCARLLSRTPRVPRLQPPPRIPKASTKSGRERAANTTQHAPPC